ncbi:MAG: TonB family protein [Lentisphaeraceae bacterium]|nr:TonB family protein [Lentisphaeraceae bacterium]
MSTELQDRLIYRSTPGAVRFAWRVVLLSIGLVAFIFVIIPFMSRLDDAELADVEVRKVPELVEVEDPEEVFEEKKPEVKQKTNDPEVQEISTPPTPPPPALPVNIEVSTAPTSVSLFVDSDFKADLDFEVETIVAVAAKSPVKTVSKTPPVKIVRPSTNYESVFSENQVDEKAQRVRYIPPIYPTRARRRNITGKVVIDCVIDTQGKVTNAKITKSFPNGYFEKSCLNVLPKLTYKPAKKNGRAVKQRTILTFEFGLQK